MTVEINDKVQAPAQHDASLALSSTSDPKNDFQSLQTAARDTYNRGAVGGGIDFSQHGDIYGAKPTAGGAPAGDATASGGAPAGDGKVSGGAPAGDGKTAGGAPAGDGKTSGGAPAGDGKACTGLPISDGGGYTAISGASNDFGAAHPAVKTQGTDAASGLSGRDSGTGTVMPMPNPSLKYQ